MSIDVLNIIKDTEKEAEQIIRQSVADAHRIVAEANDNARAFLEQEAENAEREACLLIARAEEKARQQVQAMWDKANEDFRKLRADVESRMDLAADKIIGRLLETKWQ